jgi:predicted PurR-regulated permease PerM
VAALYFGRDIIIPFALAVLLSFLLTPAVALLQRLKFGNATAVFLVMASTISAAGTMVWIGGKQFAGILEHLPEYQQNIERKLDRFQTHSGSRLSNTMDRINAILSPSVSRPQNANPATVTQVTPGTHVTKPPSQPIPVEVVKRASIFDSLGAIGCSIY